MEHGARSMEHGKREREIGVVLKQIQHDGASRDGMTS